MSIAATTAHLLTRVAAEAHLTVFGERNALVALMFHGVVPDEAAHDALPIDSTWSVTVSALDRILRYYRAHGYTFVAPEAIEEGLAPDGRCALVTFDDGYYNNVNALPVLEAHDAPGVFFVSTDNILERKSFWWDVLHRELERKGRSEGDFRARMLDLLKQPVAVTEETLRNEWGADAFRPVSDIDRPLTVEELRDLSRHPYSRIGNHTCSHAVLTCYTGAELEGQIMGAQDTIEKITGARPTVISYPCGQYNPEVLRICKTSGIRMGFGPEDVKVTLPVDMDSDNALALGRFGFKWDVAVIDRAAKFRCDAYPFLKRVERKLAPAPSYATSCKTPRADS